MPPRFRRLVPADPDGTCQFYLTICCRKPRVTIPMHNQAVQTVQRLASPSCAHPTSGKGDWPLQLSVYTISKAVVMVAVLLRATEFLPFWMG